MKLLQQIFSKTECSFLFFLLLFFSFLRLPSLFEPLWYGDEGIYQVVGRAILDGRILYSGIWDNKPPLLYLTYALVNADQFLIRLLSYLAGMFSVYGLYLLTKELFSRPSIRYVSTALFAILFAIPATEANIANAENFMLVFLIFAGLLVFKSTEDTVPEKRKKKLLLAGLLMGTAFLYKTVAALDFAAFTLFLAFFSLPKKIVFNKNILTNTFRSVLPLLAGFALPILLTIIYFLLMGSLPAFLSAVFTNNISYVGYKNFYLFPQGLLVAKLLLLLGFVLLVFWKRASFLRTSLFIFLWFAFSFFNVFFSQRAYTHYLLVGIISFSLLCGLVLSEKKYRFLSIILIIISLSATFSVFNLMKPQRIFAYYINFISYTSGNTSTASYQSFFDKDVPEDYEVADFLKMHTKKGETMFLWGNSAQIYTLSNTLPPGRYAVAYHINSQEAINETQIAIDEKKPRFLIIQPNTTVPQLLLRAYTYLVTIGATTIYERTL